jgi:lysyl-tRNA synthetase class 2
VSRSNWRPACALSALRARAELYRNIRRFFEERGVLEVETPLLCHAAGTDPHLQPFLTHLQWPGQDLGLSLYLQTSPEFAMKRLLAAGTGSIYQICKAFRNEEAGRYHNPEFTLLEWYRVGFNLSRLTHEIDELLSVLLADRNLAKPSLRVSYQVLFREQVGADPIFASLDELAACAEHHGLPEARSLCGEDRTTWLDLLFSHLVQPNMDRNRLVFVHDYPACLPSLARAKPNAAEIVERVEVFLDGLELGNGFHELADAKEQELRFDADLAARWWQGLPLPPKDERLLDALRFGLPDCSGVALGLDRILMLALGLDEIGQALAFPIDRA